MSQQYTFYLTIFQQYTRTSHLTISQQNTSHLTISQQQTSNLTISQQQTSILTSSQQHTSQHTISQHTLKLFSSLLVMISTASLITQRYKHGDEKVFSSNEFQENLLTIVDARS